MYFKGEVGNFMEIQVAASMVIKAGFYDDVALLNLAHGRIWYASW